ncbi:MAG TPA: phage holin family protein [Polyangia bacterium]|jgi:uncharacterized membrane protein YqjE|nr:phage holin family protein [Polyangia bacterium]
MSGAESGNKREGGGDLGPIEGRSTSELLQELKGDVLALSRAQIELAKAELKETVEQEVRLVAGLGIGGICALIVVNLLLVALILAVATYLPGWLAALIVAVVVTAVGAAAVAFGWSRRARHPFARSKRTLQEDAKWVRERTT